MIDEIAAVKTDEHDRPLINERMAMKLLTRREALNLEREQNGLAPKSGFFTRLFDSLKPTDYKL
jgi:peptidyl-prolyl cis-trans isomerase B (cyclophilin B)